MTKYFSAYTLKSVILHKEASHFCIMYASPEFQNQLRSTMLM